MIKLSKKEHIFFFFLAFVVFALYFKSMSFDILPNFDDGAYFADKSIQTLSSKNFLTYFSSYYLGMYQPISVFSFALSEQLFDHSIIAQRVLSLLIHVFNCFLVFRLVSIFKQQLHGAHQFLPHFAMVLFALHPMNVESVVWISARSTLLYSFFYLLALIYYFQTGKSTLKRHAIVLLFFTMALLCKVSAATLPYMILALNLIFFKALKDKLFLAISISISFVFIYIGVIASSTFGHIQSVSDSYSIFERLCLISNALWLYLCKFLCPIYQSAIYLYPSAEHGLRIEYYISLVISIILILIYAKSLFSKSFLRKFKPELTGLTIFLSAIVIFLPLYWSRTVFITERYAYIPYIGLSVFFVSLLFRITQRIERQISNLPAYLLIVVAIALGISTYVRIDVWKNPYTLFSDVVKNDRSTREVSMGLYNIGNEHLRNKNYIEAKKKYNLSIQLNDKYAEAYYNRGITNFFQKYHSEAIHDFTSALHLGGNPAMILINRAEAYRNLGKINEAYSDLCEAILSDNTGLALFSRGLLLYFSLNDQGSACADWKVSASLGNMDAKKFLITYCNQN